MLRVFYGEFLVSPVPLDLALNACSHGCAFCFSLLNTPSRTADLPRIMRLLSTFQQRDSLEARLLQLGYPVLIGNLIDPLAHSNDQQALPLIRLLVELGIPVSIQSRGGRLVHELLALLSTPVVWYLSINQDDDALRQRLEPGAPTLESRLTLCETLAARGHRVLIGFNPFVPSWWRDFPAMAQRVADAGAAGVWLQLLHFNQRQLRAMRPGARAALDPAVISDALRSYQHRNLEPLREAHAVVSATGLPVYCTGFTTHTSLFDMYHDCYSRTFPILQDWVNWCFDAVSPDAPLVSYDDFRSVLLPSLPEGEFYLHDYWYVNNRQLWKQETPPPPAQTGDVRFFTRLHLVHAGIGAFSHWPVLVRLRGDQTGGPVGDLHR